MSTMDFFEHQDRARSATRRLYFYYFLAVLFVVVALNVCLIGLFTTLPELAEPDPSGSSSYAPLTSEDLTDEDVLELRKTVGMVFQNPDNQLVATIVEDDVAFGPENLGVPSEEIRQRVDKALTDVGMLEYAKHEPHRLSGGQKQRVAIAGVMAMMPECIIFDESTAMLDPLGRKDVMESILKLNREKDITVIMITHYMDEAAKADRIVVLNDGEILLDGTPEFVFEHEELLKNCGLSIPQGTELVHKLQKAGINLDGECASLEACVKLIAESLQNQ